MSAPDQVPFVDLGRTHAPLAGQFEAAFAASLERGDFVLGEELELFEADFAGYLGSGACIGVASGTAALSIALTACGVGPGDEVIVPAHTFIASGLSVVHAGATPVFADVEEATGLLDLDSAAALAGERTAAMMPVHLYGQACDMDAVEEFAVSRGLTVIEDAAQGHGARWDGRRVGSFGTASAFSFYPSKNLGAFGDGGAICTSDPAIAERARRLRNLGMRAKGEHIEAGANERLDTLQAAILRIKLGRLDGWNAKRVEAAGWYRELLPGSVRALPERPGADDVFHLFPVRVPDRDVVAAALSEAGVGCGVHYSPAVHRQPPFAGASAEAPTAERWAAEELSLPMFPELTRPEVERTCDALAEIAAEALPSAEGARR